MVPEDTSRVSVLVTRSRVRCDEEGMVELFFALIAVHAELLMLVSP